MDASVIKPVAEATKAVAETSGKAMELRRGIAIDGSCGVMLELGGNELTRCLRWMIAANPRLSILLQLVQGDTHTLTMRLTNTVIATHEGRQ
jgi:hypothetical protein